MHMGIGDANLFTDSDIGLSKYIPPVRAIWKKKKKGWFFFRSSTCWEAEGVPRICDELWSFEGFLFKIY